MPNDVYLSSTLKDLEEERSAVRAVLTEHGFGVKQSYQASEKDLITSCLDDVAKCAVYVCIVGMRYGYCPNDPLVNPEGKSITQLEFEQATRLNLPRFVFVKAEDAGYKASDFDSHTGENGQGERIRQFRDWVSTETGVRPTRFRSHQGSQQELREKLLAAILSYQVQLLRASPLLRTDDKHLAELATPIGMVLHKGLAEPVLDEYRSRLGDDPRFKALELAPEDPKFLLRLDEAARGCRTLCWLLSPGTIQVWRDQVAMPDAAPADSVPEPLLPRALRDQARRRSLAGALLVGGATVAALPPAWTFGAVVKADPSPTTALNDLFSALRARVPTIQADRRIGIPCLVFAMTRAEALDLAQKTQVLMALIADEQERGLRAGQLAKMLQVLRPAASELNTLRLPSQSPSNPDTPLPPRWPEESYGAQREDWRPFGPNEPTAREYLAQAVERLNGGPPGRRERLFLKSSELRLQLLPYALDELIADTRGSRDAVLAMRDRGCIMLVDEMALLHPVLRHLAEDLLKGENVAVLSSQPKDPAPYAVHEALDPRSALGVGSLMSRFGDQLDPRCELAINSPARLRRWLSLVLPEMVTTLDGMQAQDALVARRDEDIFGRTVSRP